MINTNCSWNKGSAAQVISTKKTLDKLIPNTDFVLSSQYPQLDSKLCEKNNIKVFTLCHDNFNSRLPLLIIARTKLLSSIFRSLLWVLVNKFGINMKILLNSKILKLYCKSDLIIDLSGDTLSDKNCFSVFSLLNIIIGILLKKKIVIFSQSIGPFRKLTLPMARFCLNKVDLIIIRENVTKKYLEYANIDKPVVHLGADIAFLLETTDSKEVQNIFLKEKINTNNKKHPLIGIGPSSLIYTALKSNKEDYITLMAQIADFLVEKLNAQVILISHIIIPSEKGCLDDRFVAKKIHRLVRNKNRIKIVKNDYSPEELKSIISRCELFIGARMHSNIASLSTHVPTIALAWSHKYLGIMRTLEQEKYVVNINKVTFDELVAKINDAWNTKDEIRKNLAFSTKKQKKSALYTCELIKDYYYGH